MFGLTHLRLELIVLLTLFGPGCEPAQESVPQDDATVVGRGDSLWRDSDRWSLSPTPEVVIGTVDGPEACQFYGSEIAPVRLSDGRIVVANKQTGELRFFDLEGSHLLTVGRLGGGPREFHHLADVERVAGDTLVAGGIHRILWWGPDGRVLRTAHIDELRLRELVPAGHALWEVRFMADGSLLVAHGTNTLPEERLPSGIWRKQVGYMRVSLDLSEVDTIGQTLGIEEVDPLLFNERRLGYPFPPFPSRSHLAFGGRPSRICYGDSERSEVRCRGVESPAVQLIRYAGKPAETKPADIEARKTMILSWNPRLSGQDLDRTWRLLPKREAFPAFRGLHVDAEGYLWVEEYGRPGEDRTRFLIFARDGRLLGSLELLARLRDVEIGHDYLLGVWRDEWLVPFVHVYSLRRHSGR